MLNICEDVVTFEKKTKISGEKVGKCGEFYVSLTPGYPIFRYACAF